MLVQLDAVLLVQPFDDLLARDGAKEAGVAAGLGLEFNDRAVSFQLLLDFSSCCLLGFVFSLFVGFYPLQVFRLPLLASLARPRLIR